MTRRKAGGVVAVFGMIAVLCAGLFVHYIYKQGRESGFADGLNQGLKDGNGWPITAVAKKYKGIDWVACDAPLPQNRGVGVGSVMFGSNGKAYIIDYAKLGENVANVSKCRASCRRALKKERIDGLILDANGNCLWATQPPTHWYDAENDSPSAVPASLETKQQPVKTACPPCSCGRGIIFEL